MRRFSDIRLQKWRDPEIRVRGHSRSLKVVPFYRFGMVSYYCFIETLSLKHIRYIRLLKAVTLKTELRVRQGHWKYHHSIERIRLPIDVL